MRKFLPTSLILILCFLSFNALSQTRSFEKGDFTLNFGIGCPINEPLFYMTIAGPSYALNCELGAFDFGTQKGLLGVGFVFGCYKYHFSSVYDNYGYNFLFGPRFIYHYNEIDNWDFYAGTTLGAKITSADDNGDNGLIYNGIIYNGGAFDFMEEFRLTPLSFFFDIKAGVKYWITSFLGVYLEGGYSIAEDNGHGLDVVQAGISFKFSNIKN